MLTNTKKKIAILTALALDAMLLTSCGNHVPTSEEEVIVEEESEKIEFHYHMMININGTTYIIRGCDENFNNLNIVNHSGYFSYYLYNCENDRILEGDSSYDLGKWYIRNELEETYTRDLEDAAMENGAVLYRGLTK